MRSKRIILLALLGALGRVTVMAQTNGFSFHADSILQTDTNILPIQTVGKINPEFKEVYQILSTNLQGVGSDEIDQAAAYGLIHELAPKVRFISALRNLWQASPMADARVFDNSFAYFRVATVTSNLPAAFRAAFAQMTETNKSKIKGLVLDLRFADGIDYDAASKLADCFLSSDHPLLNWQTGSAHATLKADAITMPVSILINSQTTGAAEALAAVLRDTDVGLVLGCQTAGQANVFKEFPLSTGGKLAVAVGQVAFGSGKTLPQGVAPDIAIETSLEDERAYLQDPFKVLHAPMATAGGGRPVADQPRLNEVELIREHSSGEDRAQTSAHDRPEVTEPAPVITDPALARALDLLKGLAVVQPNRPG